MAQIPTDVQQRINDMYNQQKNTQLGELRANQQRETNVINTQKKETGQQYYDKRNQADVVNFQNRRGLQEMMAASGLARSGENISGQVALQASRQNTLGGLNRDEQGAINSLNTRLNEINDPSRQNSIISAIESQRSAALAEALERAIQRQQEQAQLEEQKRQFEARLAWEKEQFNRQMAEQAARAARSGGGSRRSSSSSKSVPKTTQSKTSKAYDAYKTLANSGRLLPEDQYYMSMQNQYPDQNKVNQLTLPGSNMRRLLSIPSYAGGSTGLSTAMRFSR